MEQDQTITALIEDCTAYFEQNCYTKDRVERYRSMWRNGICRYMNDNGIKNYDRPVGEKFIMDTISPKVTPAERDIIRSVIVLNGILETGKVPKRAVRPVQRKLTGPIEEAVKVFLSRLKELRRNQTTIDGHLLYLHRFDRYLENNGIDLLEDIGQGHILSFVSTQTNNNINLVSSLRMFFRFVHEERLLKTDWSYVLANYKWTRREKLPSFYTAEEVKQIESSVGRSGKVGKRNYALLLLSTRLGLRASDIAHLSFDGLDWEKSRIVLEQYKTGKEIELPLLPEIGGAVIEYLKFGRPRSNSPKVFLSVRAPYRPMTGAAVSAAVGQIIEASGISIGKRRHGPHSMRHSLAGRLLENGVPLPVISESLGHQNTEVTMNYLRIDMKALRKCALDVPTVDPSFYSQKGGVFYE